MKSNELKNLNSELKECFLNAGKRAMHLRDVGLKTEVKNDNTPVTNGDLEVNEILTKKIKELTPNIPIVSEESSLNKKNSELTKFWLIDPIDGTYDYINNKDEFTLNAALILNKRPELGIIYAPAKKDYFIHMLKIIVSNIPMVLKPKLLAKKELIIMKLLLFHTQTI